MKVIGMVSRRQELISRLPSVDIALIDTKTAHIKSCLSGFFHRKSLSQNSGGRLIFRGDPLSPPLFVHLSGLKAARPLRFLSVVRLNSNFPFILRCRLQFHFYRNTEIKAVRQSILAAVIDAAPILKDLYPCPLLFLRISSLSDSPG